MPLELEQGTESASMDEEIAQEVITEPNKLEQLLGGHTRRTLNRPNCV